MNYNQVIGEIKSGKFNPVYILHGEESYYIDRISELLYNKVLREEERDFNQAILYGGETSISDIINESRQFPMMAERRLVIVKEAQLLKKTLKDIGPYILQPTNSTVLVLCYKHGTIDGRLDWMKKAKNAVVFKSEKIREYQLVDYLTKLAQENGYRITPKAAVLFAESVGSDLARIHSELQKLAILLEKGQEINEVHIEENIGISKDYNYYEFSNAIGNRDVLKALKIIDYYEKQNDNGMLIPIIANTYGLFVKLMKMHFFQGSQNELASELKINPYIIKEYRNYQKNFTQRKIAENIRILQEYDLKSKGVGNASVGHCQLAKELVYKIL